MTAVVPAARAALLTLLWVTVTANFGLVAEEFGLKGRSGPWWWRATPLLPAVTVSYYRRRRISGWLFVILDATAGHCAAEPLGTADGQPSPSCLMARCAHDRRGHDN